MARKLSTRAALAAASALLLLLYVTSINSNTRALLSSGHDDNSPVFPSHLQDGQPSRTTAGGGVRFKPGVRLPNEGRTEAGREGVRLNSGTRSPFYGYVQRQHQEWLLRRAEELRSGEKSGSLGGGGGGAEDGAGQEYEMEIAAGEQAAEAEAADAAPALTLTTGGGGGAGERGRVVGTRNEGTAPSLDSEDWAQVADAVAAAAAAGLAGEGGGETEEGRQSGNDSIDAPAAGNAGDGRGTEAAGVVVPEAATAVAYPGGGAMAAPAVSNPEPSERRRLRRHEEPRGRHRRLEGRKVTATVTALDDQEVWGKGAGATAPSTASRSRRTSESKGWGRWAWSGQGVGGARNEERIRRLERGAELWAETYAPPIEPQRRRILTDKYKWPGGGGGGDEPGSGRGAGRILYVITSFDRGQRLERDFTKVDKLDFILMMMDEMREACQLGFSPQVHLIAAWDPSEVTGLVKDRLFCERIGEYVPYTFEAHSPKVKNNLAIKHRIYMKSRLRDFDVFVQVEDDMIFTLNHILLHHEECKFLERRRGMGVIRGRPNVFVPGFMRVEAGGDGEWVEWEITLSRFNPVKILGAGTYMLLRPSKVLPKGGNNQGLWIATREQLEIMAEAEGCRYLDFDESSANGTPETHSGSLQMFHPECGFEKVFPATHFEDFVVHHRTNNKNGRRGESIPGVSMGMLKVWAEQFIRDEDYLHIGHWSAPPE